MRKTSTVWSALKVTNMKNINNSVEKTNGFLLTELEFSYNPETIAQYLFGPIQL